MEYNILQEMAPSEGMVNALQAVAPPLSALGAPPPVAATAETLASFRITYAFLYK